MDDSGTLGRSSADQNGSAANADERYITTREAASLLGVNRATVINWARQGRFGAIQYGARGIYRFDRREIVEFLDNSRLRFADGAEGQRRPADD